MSRPAGTLHPYRLPLRRPWTTRRGRLSERRGWLVVVETGDGRRGLGDCAPLPEAGTEAPEAAYAWLEAWCAELPGATPEVALAALPETGGAARCAAESALLDLLACGAGRPLAAELCRRHPGVPPAARVAVNSAVGTADADLPDRLHAAVVAGFTVHKVKVGAGPAAAELAALRNAARELPMGHALRLDANGAWSEAQARAFLGGLEGLPLEAVEEPLAAPDAAAFARLARAAPCPLALDESLPRLGVAEVLATFPPARLVLKPTVIGGPGRAVAVARQARAAGWDCVVTTALESAVGVWAALHTAAAVGEGAPAHGLATADWFSRDLAAPPPVREGRIAVPDTPGLGVDPDL